MARLVLAFHGLTPLRRKCLLGLFDSPRVNWVERGTRAAATKLPVSSAFAVIEASIFIPVG